MGMADGNGERICRMFIGDHAAGQQHADHGVDLVLARMTRTDHGFLDLVGGIFFNRKAVKRRYQQGNAARLTEFQGRDRVLVDEGLLDGGLNA